MNYSAKKSNPWKSGTWHLVTAGAFSGTRGELRQHNPEKVWLEIEEEVHCFPAAWVQ